MSGTGYFDQIKRSFADVPVTDEGVDTVAFLEACEDLVKLFGQLDCSPHSIPFPYPEKTSITYTFLPFVLQFCCSDLFGSKAFAVVQNDLTGNITVICASFPEWIFRVIIKGN